MFKHFEFTGLAVQGQYISPDLIASAYLHLYDAETTPR
jgi:hypothetical protein